MAKYTSYIKISLYIVHSNRRVMDHDCAYMTRLINGPVAYVWAAFTALLFQAGPPAIIFHVADARENLLGQKAFLHPIFSSISVRSPRRPKGITIHVHLQAGQYRARTPPLALVTKALATKSYLGKRPTGFKPWRAHIFLGNLRADTGSSQCF